MKNVPPIYSLILSGLMIILCGASCQKDDDNTNNNTSNVTDADGNVYRSVAVGSQTWMSENLKTTKYNDGLAIPNITGAVEWEELTTGAYCWYNNDVNNKTTYGALYNGHAVNTGRLCPVEWHVASDAEWTTLITYLGGESLAGGKLKETGTTHWSTPNAEATNLSGLSFLPGGDRDFNGRFENITLAGYWWSSTANFSFSNWLRLIGNTGGAIARPSYNNEFGFSVRCVKN
ncbi:MAG: major paralogous protein [Bacteroidetes bacterium]|nr:major paralogous protein [Bacteroidota bacterium]